MVILRSLTFCSRTFEHFLKRLAGSVVLDADANLTDRRLGCKSAVDNLGIHGAYYYRRRSINGANAPRSLTPQY